VKTGDKSAAVCALDHVPAIDQPPRRQINSVELFKGQREVLIEHFKPAKYLVDALKA